MFKTEERAENKVMEVGDDVGPVVMYELEAYLSREREYQ